ncbi:MAG: Hint domain-containing protein [Pseudomonadota bacterium]
MSWVGLADRHGAAFDLTGLSNRPRRHPVKLAERPNAIAHRGTIMLEANIAQFTVPRALISHALGASFSLKIAFGTQNKLDFSLSMRDASWEERLPLHISEELQVVRVTFAWDWATRAAVLSVFEPRSQHLAQCLLPSPRAIPWAALRELIHDAPEMCRANDISFVALSRAFEATGAMPGLARRTILQTTNGPRQIGDISAGDLVLAYDGAPRRVLASVKRLMPARGSFMPHDLRAPYLGLERDLVVSGETLVELHGADVEYLLGVERVLAQANQVGNKQAPFSAAEQATICYHQLIFEDVELMDAGVGLASLNLGAALPDGLSGATTLWADLGNACRQTPHPITPYPLARPYEVVTLNAARAA